LQRDQPVEGVQVIALSEHVDYWNQLGWTDPFSSGGFSERQRRYAEEFQGEGPYTPQMVVDGKTAFVGSDSRRALQVISAAAKAPKAHVDLRCAGDLVEIRADAAPDDSDVLFAISENGLSSNVRRGENKGRVIEHDAVARRLTVIGRAKKQQGFTGTQKISLENGWRRDSLSAVVFLQGRSTHQVIGVGKIALSGCAAN